MGISEICLIGLGLAMDAFAVSVCKGLSMKKISLKNIVVIALYFSIFQAIMPVFGFFLGTTFQRIVVNIDHWIIFIVLSIIGVNMIKDFFEDNNHDKNDRLDFKTMIILALATSIDAFAVGITFAFFDVKLHVAVIIIGSITFLLSAFGVKIGNRFGNKFQKRAELFGGVILILMGLKILLEHLNFVTFK